MSPYRRYAAIGAIGGFLFCLGAAILIRSCEMRRLGVATIASCRFDSARERLALYWRTYAASPGTLPNHANHPPGG
mgnify:CR=1 FL=1